MLAQSPDSVSSIFYKKYNFDKSEPSSLINYCPAFNDNLKNLFALRSIYNYNFRINENKIETESYDNYFFNEHVTIRSLKNRFFSFNNRYIFFTDEPSLSVTFYEYPFLEDNNITTRCIIPAGTFDIGRWFRNTEFSFFLRKEFDEFKITSGEIYSYIRIHTKLPVKFIQFRYTQKISEYNKDGFKLTRNPLKKLENYYNFFKNKKLILKEIQENLL
jgi:hypothetical protein